jgi:inner membrane protein
MTGLILGTADPVVVVGAIAHAIEIGYSFGYLVDLMTKSGIQLFFPATLRCVVPGNRKLRLATGSNWEYAILGLVVALGVLVLSINTHGGLASTFNEILATPRGIQEILSKYGNTRQIIAQVEGVRMLDSPGGDAPRTGAGFPEFWGAGAAGWEDFYFV